MTETEAFRINAHGTMSCDEFMGWWQDRELRKYIAHHAWLWSKTREDYEDFRQEAWAAVCCLPADTSSGIVMHIAKQSMERVYRREFDRKKIVQFVPLTS